MQTSEFTVTINISIEQINDYVKRISDNPYVTIEHDGIMIDKVIMNEIENNKHRFIDDYFDLKRIYNMEIHREGIVDPFSRSAVDLTMFAFFPPQPYPSWVISDDTSEWVPPKPYPDGDGSGMGTLYNWNEDLLTWQDILV